MDTPITEQKTDNMDAELRANILVKHEAQYHVKRCETRL